MNFYFGDLYPAFRTLETSTEVQPEPEEKSALNENAEEAIKTNKKISSKKSIFISFLLACLLIIFLGVGGGYK